MEALQAEVNRLQQDLAAAQAQAQQNQQDLAAAQQAAQAHQQAAQQAQNQLANQQNAALVQRIQQLEQQGAQRRQRNHKFRTFGNTEEEDWLTAKEHFRNTHLLNNFTDAEGKLALAAAMVGDAALAVRDIGQGGVGRTFDDQLEVYEARFLPAAASEIAKAQFEALKQARGESALRYISRGRSMYYKAYPDELERNEAYLTRHLMLGLYDSNLRVQVMRTHPVTTNQLLEAAHDETAVISMNKYVNNGRQAGAVPMEIGALNGAGGKGAAAAAAAGGNAAAKGQGGEKKKRVRCFYCGFHGHIKKDCNKLAADLKKGNPAAIAAMEAPDQEDNGPVAEGDGREEPGEVPPPSQNF